MLLFIVFCNPCGKDHRGQSPTGAKVHVKADCRCSFHERHSERSHPTTPLRARVRIPADGGAGEPRREGEQHVLPRGAGVRPPGGIHGLRRDHPDEGSARFPRPVVDPARGRGPRVHDPARDQSRDPVTGRVGGA